MWGEHSFKEGGRVMAIDFTLTPEQKALQEQAREFAQREKGSGLAITHHSSPLAAFG